MKYETGTQVLIEGLDKKVENGVFQITMEIPQTDGNHYYLMQRIMKNGTVSNRKDTVNLRGHRGKWLLQFAKVIEPVTA